VTDVAAAYGMAGWPLAAVLAALFFIVLARSHATYWAGRALVKGAQLGQQRIEGPAWWRAMVARTGRIAQSSAARRGIALVHRWGPVAVTFAYATVGVQTAIFVGAGLVRMPYLRFTAASVPGSIIWAAIWGTVGLGAVWGAVALAARSPWALAGVLAALAAVVAALVVRSRRRTADSPAA
jgi:membrane protein DedA with SNARE-associated domain